MRTQKQALGAWGEQIAVNYLEHNGYTILERNVHYSHEELDIIAQKEDVLFFIEVKTRSSSRFGFPEQAVTFQKLKHMSSAAEKFFQLHPDSPDTWQFDVIAITRNKHDQPEIEHFENVIG